MKLTSDVKQRKQRSQHNSPNPNNSYKTKKKFTGSYTEVNPIFCKMFIVSFILIPRGYAPFGQYQESRPLDKSSEILVLNGFVNNRLGPEPIRFVRLDSEYAESDGKSMNCGRPVMDVAREVTILGADQ